MIHNITHLSIILSVILTVVSCVTFFVRSLYCIDKGSCDYLLGGVNVIVFMITLISVILLSNLSNNVLIEKEIIHEPAKVANPVQK